MNDPARRHGLDGPICPWCDYCYSEGDTAMMPGSAQFGEDVFFEACVRCGKAFQIARSITVLYMTMAIDQPRPS